MRTHGRLELEKPREELPKISMNLRQETLDDLYNLLVKKQGSMFATRTDAITYAIECQNSLAKRNTRVLFKPEEFPIYFDMLIRDPTPTDKILTLTHNQQSSHDAILEESGVKIDEIAAKCTFVWVAPRSMKPVFEKANLKNVVLYYYADDKLKDFLTYTAIVARFEKSCIVSDLVARHKAAVYFDDKDISRDYYNLVLWFLAFGLIGDIIEEGANADEKVFKKLYGNNDKSLLNKIVEGAKESHKKKSLKWVSK